MQDEAEVQVTLTLFLSDCVEAGGLCDRSWFVILLGVK